MASRTAQDKKWQAESDARTLADANIIILTPARLSRAKKEAAIMATDAKKQAIAMVKVAEVKKKSNTPAKPAKKVKKLKKLNK